MNVQKQFTTMLNEMSVALLDNKISGAEIRPTSNDITARKKQLTANLEECEISAIFLHQ